MEIKDSVYAGFLSKSDRFKYRVIEDIVIPGGKELFDPEWQKDYIAQKSENPGSYPFVFIIIQTDIDEYLGRFISFNFDIYRIIWISMNYKKCFGAFDNFIGQILN